MTDAEAEWAEAEAAWAAECARLDAAASQQQGSTAPAGTAGEDRVVGTVARPAAAEQRPRSKPLRQRVPSADNRKVPAKQQLCQPLAVLKWCFYELLLARQPAEIAERAGGEKVPVTLEQVKPRVDAQLAAQQLEIEGGAQLDHFAQLCVLLPSLVKLRWTVATKIANRSGSAPGVHGGALLDIIITTGKTAGSRLKAMERVLMAVQKRAAAALKRTAAAAKESLPGSAAAAKTLEDEVLAQLPAPSAVPDPPSEQSFTPRQQQSSPSSVDNAADELGSNRRLLSPEEVSKLPIRHPRGQDLVDFLQKQPWYSGQIVATVSRPARQAMYADLKGEGKTLPSAVYAALRSKGITKLYSHQAKAIDAALAGHHVVVSTATASGKSLAYVLPMIVETVRAAQAEPPRGCAAFCLFPTKALAQDQLRALKSLIGAAAVHDSSIADATRPTTYDGDTRHAERTALRQSCNIFLTNPDMLHASILPSHKQWSSVLSVLRFIVLDEMHVYKGVYGAHVALILRRLLRLCALYGAPAPKFICCSATLPRPRAHFERLIPRPLSNGAVVVCEDGAPAAQHWLVLWQPPLLFEAARKAAAGAVSTELAAEKAAGPEQRQHGEDQNEEEQTRIRVPDSPASLRQEQHVCVGQCSCGGMEVCGSTNTAPGVNFTDSLDFAALLNGKRSCLVPKRSSARSIIASPDDASAPDDASEGRASISAEQNCESGPGKGAEITLQGAVLTKPTPASPFKPTRSRRGSLSTAPSKRRRTLSGDDAKASSVAAEHSDEYRRCSPNIETAAILAAILTTGCRALCFTKVRRMCEILSGYTTRILRDVNSDSMSHTSSPTSGGGGWSAVAAKVGTYRGGYTAEDRRAIEAQLLGGGSGLASSSSSLQGVVCTNALELGVDIGELDAVVCLGYPGSSASLWQQVGRAGRKGESALGVVVAYDSPVDAYFIRHPDRLLQQPTTEDEEQSDKVGSERLNPYLLQAHTICAAAELPLRLPVDSSRRVLNGHGFDAGPRSADRATKLQLDPTSVAPEAALDALLFGGFQSLRDLVSGGTGGSGRVGDMLSMAVENGTDLFLPVPGSAATVAQSLRRAASATEGSAVSKGMVELWRANPALWTSCLSQQCRGPQPLVSIRAVGSTFSVQCTRSERELETVESSKAFFSLYEGSLYQHQQQLFKIVEVNPAQRLAYACPLDPPRPKYITQPVFNMTLSVCRREHRRRFGRGVELLYGRLLVSVQVTAYSKCHRRTLEAFEHIPLHGIPPMEAVTSGVWLRLGDLREELEQQGRESARAGSFDFVCGLHAANHALRTAANVVLDCDATDLNCEHESNELRILLYDSAAGGTGLSWEAYRRLTEIVDTAVLLLTECECSNGCPSCVLLSEFGCYNGDVCKRSGLMLMAALQFRLTDAGSPPSETLGTMPEEHQP
eukprot:COSAG02_NODE_1769_length_10996_cov_22.332385_2_plen_1423_part_00